MKLMTHKCSALSPLGKSVLLSLLPFFLILPLRAEKAEEFETAADFTLPDLSGKKYTLSDFRGKVVLLDFWATWCPPCRMSTPALVELNAKLKKQKAAIIGVSLDEDPAVIPAFLKKMNVSHLILHAGSDPVSLSYDIRGIPAFYILDKKGRIRKEYPGYRPGLEKDWEKVINALLLEK